MDSGQQDAVMVIPGVGTVQQAGIMVHQPGVMPFHRQGLVQSEVENGGHLLGVLGEYGYLIGYAFPELEIVQTRRYIAHVGMHHEGKDGVYE